MVIIPADTRNDVVSPCGDRIFVSEIAGKYCGRVVANRDRTYFSSAIIPTNFRFQAELTGYI